MIKKDLFNIPLNFLSKDDILVNLGKVINDRAQVTHIMSINPEIVMTALHDDEFKKTVVSAQNHIPDGIGTVIAMKALYGVQLTRLTGVDVMDMLMQYAAKYSLTVALIGGRGSLADKLRLCYIKRFPGLKIASHQGFYDVRHPLKSEEKDIFNIVASVKPHLVFVSFGSPWQELWIERHKAHFKGSLVMGVGGAFALLSNEIARAPGLVRTLGFEWLFRLVLEPWRMQRQLSLVAFFLLVVREKLRQWLSKS